MNDQVITRTSSDDNLLAAVAHFFGLLVAFIVWVAQKDKSRFVRFQAIQAMAFDILVTIVMTAVALVSVLAIIGALALGVGDIAIFGHQGNPTAEPVANIVALLTATPFLIVCMFIPLSAAVFIARLIATIQTAQGRDFHYPWLGKWIETRLANEQREVTT